MPDSFRAWIDSPRPHEALYGESISISGWVARGTAALSRPRVRAFIDGLSIGETSLLFVRPDVNAHLGLDEKIPTGFRILARLPGDLAGPREVQLTLRASDGDTNEETIGEVVVQVVPAYLAQRDHGRVLFPEQRNVLHREHIYGSGPPMDEPGAECLRTILDYLPAGGSVADIGCGSGAYGPAIMQSGRAWLGLEVNAYCLQRLRERNLPHRVVTPPENNGDPMKLPCADREFDSAVCIEVLEHIADPENFLREIARVIRGRLLVSVPNMEIVPFFKPWEVVPWHLLEADHKNFFTRASLRDFLTRSFANVEVFTYVEHPLRTRDGIPVHVHLFAVAEGN